MRFLLPTEGKSFERSLAAFRATPAGRELLLRRPDFRALYCNVATLEACPPGSLGHWYAEFMTVHGLEFDFYVDEVIETSARFSDDAARVWFHTRIYGSHDLRHVLAGYGPDVLGEVCLLWFRFAQTWHIGILALSLLGLFNLMFLRRGPAVGPLLEAYQRGRRAAPLDFLPWEDGLAEPLSAHRAAVGLTPSLRYPYPFAPEAYVGRERAAPRDAAPRSVILE
jgi:ubiquinone biosynthesis protein COQ4